MSFPPRPSEPEPNFQSQGEQLGIGLTEPANLTRVGRMLLSFGQELLSWAIEFLLKNAGRLVVFVATSLARGEDKADPVFRQLTDAAVKDLIGADASAGHAAVGRQVLDAMTGGGGGAKDGQIEPSTAGAEAFMETVMKLTLEGYLEGSLFHALSLGYLEKFGELDDMLAQVLGVSRASRAVMRPLLAARVVTPMQWHVNKTYRPELLSASDVVRQVVRGRWPREQGLEELARQGWSDDRIEALLNAAAKFHSVGDLELLERAGQFSHTQAVQHLRDQGYDEAIAESELQLWRLKRIQEFERTMANDAISAFAAGRIDRATLLDYVDGVTMDAQERAQLLELADSRRALRRKQLSPTEARAAVRAKILAVSDYRRALRDDGYDEDATLTLELLLRHELEEEAAIAELRATAAGERAAEQAAREAQRTARQLELEAERALKRRGAEADLERAAIRGLLPLARVEEIYRAKYDADTVGAYVALLEDERQRYLDEQARRAEAIQRAGRRAIDVGDLEQAVLTNVLSMDRFRSGLEARGFDAGDIDILARTLEVRKADLDAAKAARSQAGQAAKARAIDLGRFEQLVRRGVRTLADYDALLRSLDFDDAARAAMRELLELQIADDAKAQQARIDGEAQLAPRGLSLEQFRRAVVLGLQTPADYERFLLEQRFTADAIALLMVELAEAVADAEAARAQRSAAGARLDGRALPLDVVTRAARLGNITPAAYQARLERDGFSPDDVALQVDLLLAEIADVQATRRARDVTPPASAPKGVALAELARAVRRGLKTLDDFQARAVELGFSQDAIRTQTRILGDELVEAQAARLRKTEIAAQLADAPLTLAALEGHVMSGAATIDDFIGALIGLGILPEDAELLAALLLDELEAAGATA